MVFMLNGASKSFFFKLAFYDCISSFFLRSNDDCYCVKRQNYFSLQSN